MLQHTFPKGAIVTDPYGWLKRARERGIGVHDRHLPGGRLVFGSLASFNH